MQSRQALHKPLTFEAKLERALHQSFVVNPADQKMDLWVKVHVLLRTCLIVFNSRQVMKWEDLLDSDAMTVLVLNKVAQNHPAISYRSSNSFSQSSILHYTHGLALLVPISNRLLSGTLDGKQRYHVRLIPKVMT